MHYRAAVTVRTVLLLLLAVSLPGSAAASSAALIPGIASQAGMYAAVAAAPWWEEEHPFLTEALLFGTAAAAPAGLYPTRPAAAGGIHLLQGAAAAGGAFSHYQLDNSYLTSSLVNLSVKSGMYSGYLTSRDAAGEPPVPLGRLASAPVRHITSPYVWGSIALFAGLGMAEGLSGEGVPLWESDRVEIAGQQYDAALGIPLYLAGESFSMLVTGIGEEAYYRGVVYDRLREATSPAAAKAIDAVFFPLLHLPQELAEIHQGEMSWQSAALNFAVRSGITLMLDFAYDAGGLELSTAVHTWVNLALHLSRFVFGGGS